MNQGSWHNKNFMGKLFTWKFFLTIETLLLILYFIYGFISRELLFPALSSPPCIPRPHFVCPIDVIVIPIHIQLIYGIDEFLKFLGGLYAFLFLTVNVWRKIKKEKQPTPRTASSIS